MSTLHQTLWILLLPVLVLAASHSRQITAGVGDASILARTVTARDDSSSSLRLTDIILTASVDGKFHALNRTTGQVQWSMKDDPSAPGSHSFLHDLVRSDHSNTSDIHQEDVETYVIEPQSGVIFVFPPNSSPYTPLEKLGYTVAQLVDASPFRLSGDDHRIFLGRKETSLITIDIDTGNVISIFNADNRDWEEADTGVEQSGASNPYDDYNADAEPLKRRKGKRREVHVGRTDYHVTVQVIGRGTVQTLVYSEYGPNNLDRDKQSVWTRTLDDRYLQSTPDGVVSSVRTTAGEEDPVEWVRKFDYPT